MIKSLFLITTIISTSIHAKDLNFLLKDGARQEYVVTDKSLSLKKMGNENYSIKKTKEKISITNLKDKSHFANSAQMDRYPNGKVKSIKVISHVLNRDFKKGSPERGFDARIANFDKEGNLTSWTSCDSNGASVDNYPSATTGEKGIICKTVTPSICTNLQKAMFSESIDKLKALKKKAYECSQLTSDYENFYDSYFGNKQQKLENAQINELKSYAKKERIKIAKEMSGFSNLGANNLSVFQKHKSGVMPTKAKNMVQSMYDVISMCTTIAGQGYVKPPKPVFSSIPTKYQEGKTPDRSIEPDHTHRKPEANDNM